MRSKSIERILNETSLDTKIRVTTEADYIMLLTKLGLRENKMWSQDDEELLSKLMEEADKHTDRIMKLMHEENNRG